MCPSADGLNGKEAFDADWLILREAVDHRSRAEALLPLLTTAWRAHGWSRILDLGSGTGSNLRYLAPRLPGEQEWTLIDHDADLLARVYVPEPVRQVNRIYGDLADQGLAAVGSAHLVTGSALLDLVSEDWLGRLVTACRRARCGAHFSLTYNGEIRWFVADGRGGLRGPDNDSDDTLVTQSVNGHQRADKGLGCALGPTGGTAAETRFQAAGYRTWLLPSPWRLGPEDAELARALVDGWERAALEMEGRPDLARRIRAWTHRRRRTITSGGFVLTVGHVDLLALPTRSLW